MLTASASRARSPGPSAGSPAPTRRSRCRSASSSRSPSDRSTMRDSRSRSLAAAVPALVGCLATTTAGIAMWRSPTPWTFTLDTGSVFLGQTVSAFDAWFAGRVPEWSDLLWGGFPLVGDCTTAALYPLHAIVYLLTRDVPLRFFDVSLALHLGIFAAGSATLVRRLGASPAVAALAGALAAWDPFAHYCAIALPPLLRAGPVSLCLRGARGARPPAAAPPRRRDGARL